MNECKRLNLQSILLMVAIAACSGCTKDLPHLSASQLEAVNHNMRGIKAEARGNHALALEEFDEALKMNRSLDNREGSIVALVNISRVNRRIGEISAARIAIDQAIELTKPESSLFGEAAFEKSSVELDLNNLPQAYDWATKAIAASTDNKTAATNLLARILYQEKQYDPAREQAEKALSLSRQNSQPDEEANALRLLGAIHAQAGRPKQAIDTLATALDIDKAQGKSKKIAADLRGLASVYARLKQNEDALAYYRRAENVSVNNGETVQAAEDLLQMARLVEAMGDKEKSLQLLQEREALLKGSEPRQQPKLQ